MQCRFNILILLVTKLRRFPLDDKHAAKTQKMCDFSIETLPSRFPFPRFTMRQVKSDCECFLELNPAFPYDNLPYLCVKDGLFDQPELSVNIKRVVNAQNPSFRFVNMLELMTLVTLRPSSPRQKRPDSCVRQQVVFSAFLVKSLIRDTTR